MLIKKYSPQIHKCPNNESLKKDGQYSFTYKGIQCFTDPESLTHDSYTPSELQEIFREQEEIAKKELDVYMKHKLYNQTIYNTTIAQYNDLFFYNGYTYLKSALLEQSTQRLRKTRTLIEKPLIEEIEEQSYPIEEQSPQLNEEDEEKHKKEFEEMEFIFSKKKQEDGIQYIGISVSSIRSITGYTYYPIPKWSQEQKPVYIKWQQQMIEDTSNILIIDGSRQMWKSFGMSELLIEESFVPWDDILVAAYTQKTTNVILNYMRNFLKDFSEDDFTVYKKDGYIRNNTTGVCIHFRTLNDWGTNVLGLTLRLIVIDEAQLIPSTVFEDVLKPTMTTTGGRLVMIGTAIEDISSFMYETIIAIAKWEIYNNEGQKTARHIKVSAYENPLIHPLERKEIYDNKDKPSIQRQYFNKWGKGADSSFNPRKESITNNPQLAKWWHVILAIDPARKRDRSAYVYAHCYNNKVYILSSWEVPPLHKVDWSLQAAYHNSTLKNFNIYKSFSKAMDVTWVWDSVATIFRDNNLTIDHTIQYTSWKWESEIDLDDYHVAKHVLINNALDMIESWQVILLDETTKSLQEEINYCSLVESKYGTLSLMSKFFDDTINAFMIALYIARKRRYLYRTDASQSNSLSNSFTQELKSTYRRPTTIKKKQASWYF